MSSGAKQINCFSLYGLLATIALIIGCVATFDWIRRHSLIVPHYTRPYYRINSSETIRTSTYSQHDIHLAVVSGNDRFNRMTLTLIKSVMFYHQRSYNVTFHIFTDASGETLFRSYFFEVGSVCVHYQLYKLQDLLNISERFISTYKIHITHYSGLHALSKAFIHDLIPNYVPHIVILDSDILVLEDVFFIWEQFKLFRPNQTALGLVAWYPSVPTNYQYKGSNPDPYLGGVVLLDLTVCRSIQLTQLFNQITSTAIKTFHLKSFWTADQVLVSLFAVNFPQNFVALPCFINGHTSHYLKDGHTWNSACPRQYPRTVHVVPSSRLLDKEDYFGHLYIFFKDMPMEWLRFCVKEI